LFSRVNYGILWGMFDLRLQALNGTLDKRS
jgi:hypothetical protein